MEFSQLKQMIREDLQSRNLKNPSIRLNALDNIEDLLKLEISNMMDDPCKFIKMLDKEQLKNLLSSLKPNRTLNGAENSVINEMYYRI